MEKYLFRGKVAEDTGVYKKGMWIIGYYCWKNSINISTGTNKDISLPKPFRIPIIPTTLGMRSLIPDKDGKYIYSGDILECRNYIGYVKFDKGAFRFVWHEKNRYGERKENECNLNSFSQLNNLKIKGNVTDNIYLLSDN